MKRKITTCNWLILKLQEVKEKFRDIELTYYLDQKRKRHVVEISPEKYFDNPKYIAMEASTVFGFLKKRPLEGIYFVKKGNIDTKNLKKIYKL